jgi:electron transfer flavoprotein alpha subunit
MACVLVHIEADGDHPTPASLAALGEGRRVATSSGATLYAALVVAGGEAAGSPAVGPRGSRGTVIETLGRHGADKVVVLPAAGPVQPVLWETVGSALGTAVEQLRPVLTLLPASAGSHDVGARLATRFGATFVAGPIVEQGSRGEIVLSRPVYGGAWRRRTSLEDLDRAVVVILPPGLAPGWGSDEAEVLLLQPGAAPARRVRLLGESADDGAVLTSARRIVVGGGGVTRETWPLVEELARVLGAELAATRALCQRGVAPPGREIGVGTRHVAPVLYVVCGASGSAAHLGAVAPGAEIVAIDRDPDAPVFRVAAHGIVGTLEEVLPAMIDAVRGRAA